MAILTVQFVLFGSALIFLQLLYKSAKKQGTSFGKAAISQEMDLFAQALGIVGFFVGSGAWLYWGIQSSFAIICAAVGIGCTLLFGAKFGHSRILASWYLFVGTAAHGLALLALIWHFIFSSLG